MSEHGEAANRSMLEKVKQAQDKKEYMVIFYSRRARANSLLLKLVVKNKYWYSRLVT